MGGKIDKTVFLGNRVDNYLYELGFEPEKQHRFHLTLGRVHSEKQIDRMLEVTASLRIKPIGFEVNEFNLMESTVQSRGPVYKKIDSFHLNG